MESETAMRVVRGVLMVGGTGIVQVLAQLTLSYFMEILPRPRQSNTHTHVSLSTTRRRAVLAGPLRRSGHRLGCRI